MTDRSQFINDERICLLCNCEVPPGFKHEHGIGVCKADITTKDERYERLDWAARHKDNGFVTRLCRHVNKLEAALTDRPVSCEAMAKERNEWLGRVNELVEKVRLAEFRVGQLQREKQLAENNCCIIGDGVPGVSECDWGKPCPVCISNWRIEALESRITKLQAALSLTTKPECPKDETK